MPLTLLRELPLPSTPLALALSGDERWLAFTSNDQKLRVLELPDLVERKAIHLGKRPKALAFSHDSAWIAAGSTSLTVWETGTWKKRGQYKGHRRQVVRAAFSRDGTRLYGGGHSDIAPTDNSVRAWDLASGAELAQFLPFGSVCALAVSPDDQSLAVATLSGQTMLLDRELRPRWKDNREARANDLTFTPAGALLGIAGDALLVDFDPVSGARRERLPRDRFGCALAARGDRLFLAVAHGGDPAGGALLELKDDQIVSAHPLDRAIPVGVAVTDAQVFLLQHSPDRLLVFSV